MTTDFRNLIGRGAFAGEGVSQLRPTSIPISAGTGGGARSLRRAAPPAPIPVSPALIQNQYRRFREQEEAMLLQNEINSELQRIADARAGWQQLNAVSRELRGSPQPEPSLESRIPATVQPSALPELAGGAQFSAPEVADFGQLLQGEIRRVGADPRVSGIGVGREAIESEVQALGRQLETLRAPLRQGGPSVAEVQQSIGPGVSEFIFPGVMPVEQGPGGARLVPGAGPVIGDFFTPPVAFA